MPRWWGTDMNTQRTPRGSSAGFTLIEIGIIVPILIITVLILFQAVFSMIRSSTVERGRIDITYERQNAISNIESDAVLASLFLPTVDTNPAGKPVVTNDPYPPASNGGAWSYLGDSPTSRVLIVRLYSTTTNPLAADRQPVFIDDNEPAGAACDSTNIYFNEVQQYNIIYFVQGGNLFRRKLPDTTTPLCLSGQYQKLSCPSQADLTAQGLGTRNSICGADDELLATGVTNFSVQYYGSKTSSTPLAVYDPGADPALVTISADAEVTLTLSRVVSGETATSTSSLRMSKLNAKIEAQP